jgi:DNA-binding response OmpR family regulator
VLAAEHAAAAMQLLAAEPAVDLLLTDVILPGGANGATLARRMTAQRSGLRTLFMSGYADDLIRREGGLDRSIALMRKPFGPDELAARVRHALDA